VITGAALLFVLGFMVAACGSGTPASTGTTTLTPGPAPSSPSHPVPEVADPPPDTTRTSVTTIAYLGTNGRESTQTFTYTTTEQTSGGTQAMTFTDISAP
jgi:hypothetical protein